MADTDESANQVVADAAAPHGGDSPPAGIDPAIAEILAGAGDDGGQVSQGQDASSNPLQDPEYRRLTAQGQDLLARKQAATGRLLDQMGQDQQTLQGIRSPQLERQPRAPKQQMGQGVMEFMQIAALIGALGGGRARSGATAALNAFAGGLKGFAQGNEKLFEQNLEQFKIESQRVKDDNDAKLTQYDLILKNTKLSMDQKLGMLKIAASQYDDAIKYNLAERKEYNALVLAIENEKRIQRTYGLQLAKFQETISQHEMAYYGRGINGRLLADWRQDFIQKNGHPPSPEEEQEQAVTINSQQRAASAIGLYGAKVGVYAKDFMNNLPNTLGAIDQIPNGKFVPWNRLKNMSRSQMSSEAQAQLQAALFTIRTIYTRSINPTGNPRVADRASAEADNLLNAASSPAALRAQLRLMAQELNNTALAIQDVQGKLTNPERMTPKQANDAFDRAVALARSGGALGVPGSKASAPGAAGATSGDQPATEYNYSNGKFIPVQ